MKRKTERILINDKTFFEWLDEQPDYGICNPPMNAQMGLDYLFDYLEIPSVVMPESCEQCNTEIVFWILNKYSRKFRKEYKQWMNRKYKEAVNNGK